MPVITDRYEILFLYEATDCNPNGDPLDENRPRTDPETGEATISDVRIKRTVRDYFLSQEPDVEQRLAAGREVLIRDTLKPDGHLAQGEDRAEHFLAAAAKGEKGEAKRQAVQEAVLSGCIDARLFGATLPLGKSNPSLQLTGPVQFAAFNRSLHRVSPHPGAADGRLCRQRDGQSEIVRRTLAAALRADRRLRRRQRDRGAHHRAERG